MVRVRWTLFRNYSEILSKDEGRVHAEMQWLLLTADMTVLNFYVEIVSSFGFRSLFIMQDHLISAYNLLGAFYLQVGETTW